MSSSTVIEISESDPTPPFEQIRKQLARAIVAGYLKPGQKLAPVRQLAGDLGVAPGTVARAYKELEAKGWIVTKRGGGTRVSAHLPIGTEDGLCTEPTTSPAPPFGPTTPAGSTGGMPVTRTQQTVTVHALIQSHDSLLLIRAVDPNQVNDLWTLPSGDVEWGENPNDAVTRHITRETGLVVSGIEVLDVSSAITVQDDGSTHAIRITYRAQLPEGEPRIAVYADYSRAEWVARTDLSSRRVDSLVSAAISKMAANT